MQSIQWERLDPVAFPTGMILIVKINSFSLINLEIPADQLGV